MYSLYRAWLMRDAVAAASLATPPDVIINVGATQNTNDRSYQFVAHRHLVSLHSGYLKALIQNETSNNNMITISVPSINPDTFSPLLSFMYTGYLDLNNENIYSILLATHLLHMPRALELCRTYLVQNQQPRQEYQLLDLNRPTTRNIIKPIPSKISYNFTQHGFWNPVNVPPLSLHTTPNGPFQSVLPDKLQIVPEPEKYIDVENRSPLPSTSKSEVRNSPRPSISPCPSTTSCTSDDRTVNVAKSPERKICKRKESKRTNNENKVVLDVACCDGPVRFHRVLNESYGLDIDETKDDTEDQSSDQEYLKNYPKTQFLQNKASERKFKDFMHQQLVNSKCYKKKTEKGVIQMRKLVTNDNENENSSDQTTQDTDPDKIYTCVYCNHTFKSQYCYQKHARRHINPVDIDKTSNNVNNTVIIRKVVSTTKQLDDKKREVRLLDMNVQYYPCKTCGSKFPSYYFVHKHRKMCHSNEEHVDNEDSNDTKS